ncbi:MAG: GNAT family N-acetyltransferase [Micropepsaceae bacterium]
MTVTLRRATPDDIAFMMQAERGPGYDRLVGQSSAETHAAFIADPANAVLVAARDDKDGGFVILSGLQDRHNGICLKRVVSATLDGGFGTAMVQAALDWIFSETGAPRAWLDTLRHNTRAAHVYRKIGFVEEGVFREAYEMPDGARADRIVFSILRREWLSA